MAAFCAGERVRRRVAAFSRVSGPSRDAVKTVGTLTPLLSPHCFHVCFFLASFLSSVFIPALCYLYFYAITAIAFSLPPLHSTPLHHFLLSFIMIIFIPIYSLLTRQDFLLFLFLFLTVKRCLRRKFASRWACRFYSFIFFAPLFSFHSLVTCAKVSEAFIFLSFYFFSER